MKNLNEVMTRDEAITDFIATVLPAVVEEYEQDGVMDEPARSEAWNNFTDYLCKAGLISDWQYDNWTHPDCCNRNTDYINRVVRGNSFTFNPPLY